MMLLIFHQKIKETKYFVLGLIAILIKVSDLKAQQWHGITLSPDAEVHALLNDTISNSLYVGGAFLSIGVNDYYYFAVWDGTNWSHYGTGTDFFSGPQWGIACLEKYNNHLFAGGDFGNPPNNISEWDGSNWNSMNNGVDGGTYPVGSQSSVQSMITYNNKLYATGSFKYINPAITWDTVNSITTWDNTQFNQITDVTGTQIGLMPYNLSSAGFEGRKMVIFNNELYIAGYFSGVAGVNVTSNVAKTDGQNWYPVGTSLPLVVYTLCEYNGSLYAGGNGFNLFRYDGTNWVPVANINGGNPTILAMTVYHNDLVITGTFDSVDNVAAQSIARWNGTIWSPFSTGLATAIGGGQIYALEVFQDNLYAGGQFTIAGGIPSNFIAYWSEPTAIAEAKPFSTISINPNPVKDKINLPQSLKNKFNYNIKDLRGKVIIDGIKKERQTDINIHNLSPGIYIVTFENEKQKFVGKFLKE